MTLYVGYLASALVLCTFLTRTMKPLRCIALGSNVAFITYSAMLQLYPVLILHCILLPVNVWRLWEIMRLGKSVDKAIDDSKLFNALVPFAKRLKFSSGEILIRKADPSDALLAGTLWVEEAEVELGPGSIVGEMGVLSAPSAERRPWKQHPIACSAVFQQPIFSACTLLTPPWVWP